jgi:hypothetical protein
MCDCGRLLDLPESQSHPGYPNLLAVRVAGIRLVPDMHQPPADTRLSWSRSPLVPLAVLWATLWTLVAIIESSYYIHSPSIPRWQPLTLILSLTCTITVWLTFELRSARYLRFPLEPPRPWFLHHLRRLPILASGYVVIRAADDVRRLDRRDRLVRSRARYRFIGSRHAPVACDHRSGCSDGERLSMLESVQTDHSRSTWLSVRGGLM